jgi:hypothetical protein
MDSVMLMSTADYSRLAARKLVNRVSTGALLLMREREARTELTLPAYSSTADGSRPLMAPR